MTASRRSDAKGGRSVRVAVATRPGGQPPEQDAWVASRADQGELLLAVIDGAGIRVPLGQGEPPDSQELVDLVAASLVAGASGGVRRTPAERLEGANEAARSHLRSYPAYQAIWSLLESRPEPLLHALGDMPKALAARIEAAYQAALGDLDALDTRYLRLVLPACVLTVASVDLASGSVEFAHLGDTVLLRVGPGSVSRVTQDQMGRFDDLALAVARAMVAQSKADSIAVADSLLDVKRRDILNGVRHNYVDEDGSVVAQDGCGVINGQKEMTAFIQSGSFVPDAGEVIALLSDGMALPLRVPEVEGVVPEGLVADWRGALERLDPSRLVASLDAILDLDQNAAAFPRLKDRDDATAVIAYTEET